VAGILQRWLDPTEQGTVGKAPDYRYSLANERTFLAWTRTSLALLAGGLAIANLLPAFGPRYLREGIAVSLMLLGGFVAVRAVDRWSRNEQAIRLGQPLPVSRLPALLAVLLGFGALVLIVVTAIGFPH
jgi:putative membrane protein